MSHPSVFKKNMSAKGYTQSLRIIAGLWRGAKIYFKDYPGLRPTQDRIRETAFNWLQFDIVGSNCLDLYSGTGIFCFEALSRGAHQVTFIEKNRHCIDAIKDNLQYYQVDNSSILRADALQLDGSRLNKPFDIVFLDPPFMQDLLRPSFSWLKEHELVTADSLIYFEAEKALEKELGSLDVNIIKLKSTKNLVYGLCQINI
jgi:16S rRNA (guanine966-N2)-methyltransferase